MSHEIEAQGQTVGVFAPEEAEERVAGRASRAQESRHGAAHGRHTPAEVCLWLAGGTAMLDGRPCRFTVSDQPGVVVTQFDDTSDASLTRLDEPTDVVWDLPGPPDLGIFALTISP
jgi:hypothetical protein